jgi:hypothetical protein
MAMGQKTNAITQKGSNIAVFAELINGVVCISTTHPLVEMPIIASSDFNFEVEDNEVSDESLKSYPLLGQESSAMTLTVLQKDYDTLNFFKKYKGKNLTVLKFVSDDELDGDHVLQIMPSMKVKGNFNLSAPDGTMDIELLGEALTADTAINLASFANSKFPATLTGSVTVERGAYYAFVTL